MFFCLGSGLACLLEILEVLSLSSYFTGQATMLENDLLHLLLALRTGLTPDPKP